MLLYNCRKEKVIKMRQGLNSQWNTRLLNGAKNTHGVFQMYKLVSEIENLDKAHKRAKRELRKQQKALEYRNTDLKAYRDWIDKVYAELGEAERKYKHTLKACDEYFEENQELKEENQELKVENERLKKELKYQELKNNKLTDANVNQFETIMQRNAEVRALKHMLDRLEENR